MPGDAWPAEILARRHRERDALVATARDYVAAIAGRFDLVGAAVIGSVARGDFNVWSDIDVLIVARGLAERYLDRAAALTSVPSPRIQAFAFTPEEFVAALRRRDPRAVELARDGVVLAGEPQIKALLGSG